MNHTMLLKFIFKDKTCFGWNIIHRQLNNKKYNEIMQQIV